MKASAQEGLEIVLSEELGFTLKLKQTFRVSLIQIFQILEQARICCGSFCA